MRPARLLLRSGVEATLADSGWTCESKPDLTDALNELYPRRGRSLPVWATEAATELEARILELP